MQVGDDEECVPSEAYYMCNKHHRFKMNICILVYDSILVVESNT